MTFFAALTFALSLLQIPTAVATFEGTFKSADKKYVNVQVESGDTMRMYITRGTKFILNGKPAHAGDFHEGDKISVDAERDARLNLLAVRIENAKPEAPSPSPK